jgi:uncharacterized protein (DUF58 family)
MDAQSVLSRKIRMKNYVLPIAVAGLVVPQFMASQRAWDFLLAAFGGAFLLSTIWAFSLLWGLSIHREMKQGWGQVGDRFSEQFSISNKGLFPALAATVIDHSDFPWYKSNAAWPIVGNLDRVWFMDNIYYKRGLFTVGPTEIHTRDPFGIFEVIIRSSLSKEILITPPIVALNQIDFASGDWHGDGGSKSKSFERTVTAASVREYVSGDSLFSIHWLTSARRDDFYVRTYDQQPSSDWWIILDMDRDVQAGEELDSTEEYATILAASIADRGLRENRAVGLVGEGSKQVWLPPKTGSGQRAEIMGALAVVNKGNTALKDLLSRTQRFLGRKSSAIIITPSVDPAWLAPLTTLKQRGITTTVLLLNQLEFGGSQPHDLTLDQLTTWGIRNYLIGKNVYFQPEIQDFFPRQTRVSPFGPSSARGEK